MQWMVCYEFEWEKHRLCAEIVGKNWVVWCVGSLFEFAVNGSTGSQSEWYSECVNNLEWCRRFWRSVAFFVVALVFILRVFRFAERVYKLIKINSPVPIDVDLLYHIFDFEI